MSSVEYLRQFVNERLTAVAEEIFGVFAKTIIVYEEEIDRQRRLLDIVWKPEIKLHRIELPQQHVRQEEEEEALSDQQQLCIQERNFSQDQEDPDPLQIKEEQEELSTSQEGEQLVLKQETESFMLTSTSEESDHSDQMLELSIGETQFVEEQHKDSGSTLNVETETTNKRHRKSRSVSKNIDHPDQPQRHCDTQTELPQQHVCKEEEEEEEEEALSDQQQLCSQERNSSLDQEDPDPLQSQEGEQLDDPDYLPTNEENDGEDLRGRLRKRKNPEEVKANIQKRRRVKGQSNLGHKKDQAVLKPSRRMGMPCQSTVCQRSSKLNCSRINERKREDIYNYFWGKLDREEQKMYVRSLVVVDSVKRHRIQASKSRRTASLFCFLCVDGRRLRVCQKMFLSTLGISQWSIFRWMGRRGESLEKTERVRVRTEEQNFLKSFLLDLPKVPPPHCRSSSSKLYLEPFFKSINNLHKHYKRSCEEHNIGHLSTQVFTKTFHSLNISLYQPKKD